MIPGTPEANAQSAPVWNTLTRAGRREVYLFNEAIALRLPSAVWKAWTQGYPEQVDFPERFTATQPSPETVATPVHEPEAIGGVFRSPVVEQPKEGYHVPPLPMPTDVAGGGFTIATPQGLSIHMAGKEKDPFEEGKDAYKRGAGDERFNPYKTTPWEKGDPEKKIEWDRGQEAERDKNRRRRNEKEEGYD